MEAISVETQAGDAVRGAKIGLLYDYPFFGVLSMHLDIRPGKTQTLATDGKSIFYNPQFVLEQRKTELQTIVAHELIHVAFGHPLRCGNRNLAKWRIAADHVVNNVLVDAGFAPLEGWVCDRQYAGMSAEEVYDLLPDDDEQEQSDCSCGMMDEPENQENNDGTSGMPEAERQEVLRDMANTVAQAAIASDFAGELPGFIKQTIRASREASVDWRAQLNEYCKQAARNDFGWTPPNRKFLQHGIILPSVRNTEMGDVAILIDSSGSVNKEALAKFADEVSSILGEVKPTRIYVLAVDSKVQKSEEYTPEDLPIDLPTHGGGGTDFRPGFQWLEDNGITPAVALYFTDLFCSKYPDEPDYPVIWVSPKRVPTRLEPKFGAHVALSS